MAASNCLGTPDARMHITGESDSGTVPMNRLNARRVAGLGRERGSWRDSRSPDWHGHTRIRSQEIRRSRQRGRESYSPSILTIPSGRSTPRKSWSAPAPRTISSTGEASSNYAKSDKPSPSRGDGRRGVTVNTRFGESQWL